MKNESYLVRKERCPKCAELGKDRNGDNLAVYSDSHSHCFSCGYTVRSNGVQRFLSSQQTKEIPKQTVFLPEDCDTNYPARALDWCGAYEIQRTDLLNNNVLWSEKEQRLLFPIYGDGFLIAYQGRDFSLNKEEKRPKWFGRGDLKNTFNILGKGDRLVLTEDIVSSIKVAKCDVQTMPLYGSFISKDRFSRLKLLGYNDIYIFLDPDKRKESIDFSRLGRLYGLNTKSIFSDYDPKELTFNEIKEILNEH